MNHLRFLLLISTTAFPFLSGCAAVIGPHRVTKKHQSGLQIIHLEGYGCNIFSLKDTCGLQLGWYQRMIVFEEPPGQDDAPAENRFAMFGKLPDSLPLHYSTVDVGATAGWEPLFRGISLGIQSRSLSRLPLDQSLILTTTRTTADWTSSEFSLHRIP
jgi:hypothetical protein